MQCFPTKDNIYIEKELLDQLRQNTNSSNGYDFDNEKRSKYEEDNINLKDNQEKEEKNMNSNITNNKNKSIPLFECYICLNPIKNPRMCPFCNISACETCLINYYKTNNTCSYCNSKTSFQDTIPISNEELNNVQENLKTQIQNQSQTQTQKNKKSSQNYEFCPIHKNDILQHYCVDCSKAYCGTCFLFNGKEKEKHIKHRIVNYFKYKELNIPLFKKNKENFSTEIKSLINLCKKYLQINIEERRIGIKQIEKFKQKYINQMEENSKYIKGLIKKLEKFWKDIESNEKNLEILLSELSKEKYNNLTNNKKYEDFINENDKIFNKKFLLGFEELDTLENRKVDVNFDIYETKKIIINYENINDYKNSQYGIYIPLNKDS